MRRALAAAVLLVACGRSGPGEALDGLWVLVGVGDGTVIGSPVVEFSGGRIGGWIGCSSFVGEYSVSGTTLRVVDIRAAEAACGTDELFRQEQRILDVLGTSPQFAIEGDRLTLSGLGRLTFERSDAAPSSPALRLTAYVSPRPGEVLLEWAGGPSGFRQWEYRAVSFPEYADPEWNTTSSRSVRLNLTPGRPYYFMVRERGDPRDPRESNPNAAVWLHTLRRDDDGVVRNVFGVPLEPGERFWIDYYGLWVKAPPVGKFVFWHDNMCVGYFLLELTLPTDLGEVVVIAKFWMVPAREDVDRWAEVWGAELLSGRARELQLPDALTAHDRAKLADTPEMREAYRLLVQVIEEAFGGYPPTASDELAERISNGCI